MKIRAPKIHSWLIVIAFLSCSMPLFLTGCSKLPAEYTNAADQDGHIRLPLTAVNDGSVHFYTYRKSGKRINFFVRTDKNNQLSAHFDACFTCYKSKKGYRVEGTDLVCNECNLRFPVAEEHWDNSKGCSPILLRSTADREYFILTTSDVEKGERLF